MSGRRIISALRICSHLLYWTLRFWEEKERYIQQEYCHLRTLTQNGRNGGKSRVSYGGLQIDSWALTVLELVTSVNDVNHFLSLPGVCVNKNQGEEDELDKLAVTSFTTALAAQAPNGIDCSLWFLRHSCYSSKNTKASFAVLGQSVHWR